MKEAIKDADETPTVSKIVQDWLKDHGFDGLCAPGCGCNASLPCDSNPSFCKPAYKIICPGHDKCPGEGCELGDENIGGECFSERRLAVRS